MLCKLVGPYHLSSQLPYNQWNTILHHCLAIWVVCYFFFIFHWFSNNCSYYLHSNNGYWTVRISSLLIDFYLITFGTHIDISPTFLSSLFARAWCLSRTYSHFSFNIYLGAQFTIKTYIQLWNKPAFTPYSLELICTCLNHWNHLRQLPKTHHPHHSASFAFILISLLVPLILPRILSESHVALEARSCQSWHYLSHYQLNPQHDRPNIQSVFGAVLKLFGHYNLTFPIASQCAFDF